VLRLVTTAKVRRYLSSTRDENTSNLITSNEHVMTVGLSDQQVWHTLDGGSSHVYSQRNTTAGLTRVARRAGR